MSSLGTIYVDLQANTGGFVSALSKAAATSQRAARDMSREFQSLGRVASQTFGAFGDFNPIISKVSFALQEAGSAASSAMKSLSGLGSVLGPLASLGAGGAVGLVALAAGAVGIAASSAEASARMYDLARSTGISAGALAAWSFAAKQTNLDQQAVVKSLELLSANMLKAAQGGPASKSNRPFKELQLDVHQANGELKNAGDFMVELLQKLSTLKDRTAAIGYAKETAGKGGAQMLQLGDAQEIEHWISVFKQMHPEFDANAASAAEFEKQLGLLKMITESWSDGLMRDLLPTMRAVATFLAELGTSAKQVQGAVPVEGFWQSGIQNTAKSLALLEVAILEVLGRAAQMVDWLAEIASFGIATKPAENLLAINKALDANADSVQKLLDSIDRANEMELKRPQMAADILSSAGPKPDPKLAEYLHGLSGEELQKIGSDAMKAHQNVAQFATDLMKLRSNGTANIDSEKQSKAAEKLAAAIASVTARANEEIATFGAGGEAAEIYRLKVMGATEADLKQVEALLHKADAFKKLQPPTKASIETAKAQGEAAGAAAAAELSSITAALAPSASTPLPDLSALQSQPKHPAQIALEKAQEAGLLLESRAAGKFGFKGENVDSLQQMRDALASVSESVVTVGDTTVSVGGSIMLVDAAIQKAMTSATERFDEAALAAGTLREKTLAMFNEIQLAGQNFGGKVFEAFGKGIDGISGQLAHLIITGKSSFRQMFDGIAEEILKAQIQFAFSKVIGGAFGAPGGGIGPGGTAGTFPGRLPGGQSPAGIGGMLAGVFGLKSPGASGSGGPLGSAANPIYSIIADSSGNAFDSGNPLPLPTSQGALTQLSRLASPGSAAGASDKSGTGQFSSMLSSLTSTLQKTFSSLLSGLSGILKGLGGGISSGFTGFLGLFGRAGGGNVSAGGAYVVGENRPEIFVPRQSGTIIPSISEFIRGRREYGGSVTAGMRYLTGESRAEVFMPNSSRGGASSGGGNTTHVHFTVNGVQDADSFRRSQGQIQAELQQQMSIAHYRNRGGY